MVQLKTNSLTWLDYNFNRSNSETALAIAELEDGGGVEVEI